MKKTTSIFTVAMTLALAHSSYAANVHWTNGGTNEWSAAPVTNWSTGTLPGTNVGDVAVMSGNDNPIVSTNVTGAANEFDITVRSGGDLRIAANMDSIRNFDVGANGNTATGNVYHTAGIITTSGNLTVGTDDDAIGNTYDLSGTSAVNVGGNFTLGVNGAFTLDGSNAFVTVGDSTTENFTMETTAHLKFTLDDSGIGMIDVQNLFTIDSTDSLLTLDLSAYTGTGEFDLVSFDSLSGAFDSGNITGLTGLSGGRTASINYDLDSMNLVISAVPEPSSIALLGLGLGAITLRRRRS